MANAKEKNAEVLITKEEKKVFMTVAEMAMVFKAALKDEILGKVERDAGSLIITLLNGQVFDVFIDEVITF